MNDTASLFDTEALLSDGIKSTPPSFVRSILKAASDPNVTSFAGGLPNPISFPEDELLKSMERVVAEQGPNAFQYSSTAGIDELRQWVADRYNKRFGTDYVLDDVLITTGSQQILDLLGKVLLDKGDGVIVGEPHLPCCHPGFRASATGIPRGRAHERRAQHRRAERSTRCGCEDDLPYPELPESYGPYLYS